MYKSLEVSCVCNHEVPERSLGLLALFTINVYKVISDPPSKPKFTTMIHVHGYCLSNTIKYWPLFFVSGSTHIIYL